MDESPAPNRQPLDPLERRVLGALVEKAKTTPDAYPLSMNALRTACNQKNNRYPQMELDEEQVERAADALRQRGALTIVQGDSRVERFRHRAYEWLGVEKVELAVMAELLLRGAQTVGELRGRAARMEPIKGLEELEPVLDSLSKKGLVLYLSPPGRGAVVTHSLYAPSELERVRRDVGVSAATPTETTSRPSVAVEAPVAAASEAQAPTPIPATAGPSMAAELASLRADLTSQIEALRNELHELREALGA
ncbi:MAG: DUF480 domain-containing protein [Lacipirellulaceae bacterium]